MPARLFLDTVDPWINWDWLSTHVPYVWAALEQHIVLTVIAVAAGLIISLPLGVAAQRSGAIRLPVLGAFGGFYTIPRSLFSRCWCRSPASRPRPRPRSPSSDTTC